MTTSAGDNLRRPIVVIATCSLAVLIIIALIYWRIQAKRQNCPHMVVAVSVRSAVKDLNPVEISCIYLDAGPYPGGVVVRDRKLIALMLQGLKKAEVPEPMYWDRTDHVTLKLKNGKTVGSFDFNLQHRADAFSPEFIAGLKAAGLNAGTQP